MLSDRRRFRRTVPVWRLRYEFGILVFMKGIIDTHAHLCDPIFDPDRANVLETARLAGVTSVIAVGENLEDAEKNLALAEMYPAIRAAAGLFPTIIDMELAGKVRDFISHHAANLVAIGEVGLDYWKVQGKPEREIQREIFRTFIELSRTTNLPLNVHSRSAGRHAIEFLLMHSAEKVQLHAFDGKASSALPAIEAGFFFSIPPSVIRSPQKQKLVKKLPLSSILIETDSPVLGPDTEKRNEPANAIAAVQAIAELKGIGETAVREAAAENTRRLYGAAV